jgi:exopolysaccharide production protein ExoF
MRERLNQTPAAVLTALVLGFSAFVHASVAANEPYLLSVSDRLAIRVIEWKASESVFTEWTALGGEYVIGADGKINVPMIGSVESAGKTSAELAAALGSAFQQALGLTVAPTASVEIAQYGPIYVSGDVATPGEYPFAPNLTVAKALALAGGERRGNEAGARGEREILTTAGTLEVLEDEFRRLLLRRARLDAELAGADAIVLPAELADLPGADAMLAAEQAIMDAQARQQEAQATSLTEEANLFANQVAAFEQKRGSTETQLVVAREQLARIEQLSDDGLALASRVASLQTNVADLESRLLDTQTAALQAQQDISEAERERARLADQRLSDISLERQTVEGEVAALALRIETQRGLVRDAVIQNGAGAVPGLQEPGYSYTILRDGAELQAEPGTPLQAGDVISARLNLPPLAGEATP